jgi:hypothetical protein
MPNETKLNPRRARRTIFRESDDHVRTEDKIQQSNKEYHLSARRNSKFVEAGVEDTSYICLGGKGGSVFLLDHVMESCRINVLADKSVLLRKREYIKKLVKMR